MSDASRRPTTGAKSKSRKATRKATWRLPAGLASKILRLLRDGHSLLSISKRPGFPNRQTLYEWAAAHPEFGRQFARARELGEEALLDQMLELADAAELEDVPLAKLQIETRQKWLANRNPAKYGSKVQVGGDAAAPPIQISDADAAREIRAILAAAGNAWQAKEGGDG